MATGTQIKAFYVWLKGKYTQKIGVQLDEYDFDDIETYLVELLQQDGFQDWVTRTKNTTGLVRRHLKSGNKAFIVSNVMPGLTTWIRESRKVLKSAKSDGGLTMPRAYNQAFDIRMFGKEATKEGWCLGVVAHWLRSFKWTQVDFEASFFADREEIALHPCARIMRTQEVMNEQFPDVQDKTRYYVKQVMDYVVIRNAEHGVRPEQYKSLQAIETDTYAYRYQNDYKGVTNAMSELLQHITNKKLFVVLLDGHAVAIAKLQNGAFTGFDPNLGVLEGRLFEKGLRWFMWYVGVLYCRTGKVATIYTV
jgi:hypothetical protein